MKILLLILVLLLSGCDHPLGYIFTPIPKSRFRVYVNTHGYVYMDSYKLKDGFIIMYCKQVKKRFIVPASKVSSIVER